MPALLTQGRPLNGIRNRQSQPSQLAGLPAKTQGEAKMFKLTSKAVKVEIDLNQVIVFLWLVIDRFFS